ncbi:unnamed protein product [Protopolystoma xenopodis]|uniref:Uncharacterized protein n=1 Tax=Protopolystoma xenopodis TaxID=117903 RepID=A0A3S5BT88_9PLAT|nr:unnamed protein product [Protopolystoma xenopodis]
MPDTAVEDIHLVLEYKSGDRFRNFTSPRSNRYILIHDVENPRLSGLWPGLMEAYHRPDPSVRWSVDAAAASGNGLIQPPDLVVIGGLQTMDHWAGINGHGELIRCSRFCHLYLFMDTLCYASAFGLFLTWLVAGSNIYRSYCYKDKDEVDLWLDAATTWKGFSV